MNKQTMIEKIRPKLYDFNKTFGSPHGKRVLEYLRKEFDGPLVGKDSNETYLNLGRRDVIKYIETALGAYNALENKDD